MIQKRKKNVGPETPSADNHYYGSIVIIIISILNGFLSIRYNIFSIYLMFPRNFHFPKEVYHVAKTLLLLLGTMTPLSAETFNKGSSHTSCYIAESFSFLLFLKKEAVLIVTYELNVLSKRFNTQDFFFFFCITEQQNMCLTCLWDASCSSSCCVSSWMALR